jgi:CarD family transcriptional regulator
MFKIGDLLIYSGHGICKVEDICDKTYAGITRTYYVLQPVGENQQLTISTPVDNDKTVIMSLINKEDAIRIIESFRSEGTPWIERHQLRAQVYNETVRKGHRMDIAKVANTLIRKKHELEMAGRKFHENDIKLLTSIQNILYEELAQALHTTYQSIMEQIHQLVLGHNQVREEMMK